MRGAFQIICPQHRGCRVSLKSRGFVSEGKNLALLRLKDDGEIDRSFGRRGMVRIPFPGGSNRSVYLEGMDVRGGQAAVSATYCGACRPAVALVDLE